MSQSDASICNLALGHLGHDKPITALTDRSTEARACNTYYETVRNQVLRDYAWPFATTLADLALVSEFADVDDAAYDPNAEWAFAYAMPSDCLKVLRLPYGSSRNPTPETTVKYRIKRNPAGGQLIYTDQDAATIEYIVEITDPTEFAPDFVMAFSRLLAAHICPLVVTEGQPVKAREQFQLYAALIATAKATAANEETPDASPDGPYLSARN